MTTKFVGEPTCPNLKFVAIVEDESTKQFSCVVEFASIFGETRHIWIKRSDFDDIKILTATLKDRGAELSPDPDVNADAIKSLVASGQSAQKWKVAACTGWRNSSGQYVTRFTDYRRRRSRCACPSAGHGRGYQGFQAWPSRFVATLAKPRSETCASLQPHGARHVRSLRRNAFGGGRSKFVRGADFR